MLSVIFLKELLTIFFYLFPIGVGIFLRKHAWNDIQYLVIYPIFTTFSRPENKLSIPTKSYVAAQFFASIFL